MEIVALTDEKKAAVQAAIKSGHSNRKIAKDLGVSAGTARRYREKMGASPTAVVASQPVPGANAAAPAGIEAPLPSIDAGDLGLCAGLVFYAISAFLGPGWALSPSEQREWGEAAADVVPSLPAPIIAKVARNVKPLKLGAVTLKILRPRVWAVMQNLMGMNEAPAEVPTFEVPPTSTDWTPPPPPGRSVEPQEAGSTGPSTKTIIDPQSNTLITVPIDRTPVSVNGHKAGIFDNLR